MEDKIRDYKKLNEINSKKWQKLSRTKIFFGHQSVGNDIINGIQDVKSKNKKIKIRIFNIHEVANMHDGFLLDEPNLGNNENPRSKILAFKKIIEEEIGNKIDIAFMKFCFVDFMKGTDIVPIFNEYKKNIEKLEKLYPNIKFIHFTVPLLERKEEKGIKFWLKKHFRSKNSWWSDEHNIIRNKMNNMIRKEYENTKRLFDLAKIESTLPNGSRCKFEKEGKTYYSLYPNYSFDGGHLNELGRETVATELLMFLISLI